MGLRFRKSIKVAPGVKVNIGKKSAGVSIGGKHGGVSFNTRSGARARVSAPGTGLSYNTKIGGKSGGSSNNHSSSTSGPSNGGGCLMTCLKIIGIIILLPLLLAFGWIIGIVWLLFFRKKLAEDPDKQKKYTIIVSILSAISLLIMIYAIATPSESTNEPVSNKIEKDDDGVSNDKEKENLKTTDENSDDKKNMDEDSDSNSEPDEQPSATNTQDQNDTNSNNSTAVVAPVPLPQTEQQVEQPQEQPTTIPETPSDELVWIDDSAARYHLKSDCSGMDNARQVPVSEAQSLGKTPCGRCYR